MVVSNYGADNMLVLEGLEAVRKRPGMYIGGTDSNALMHLLWETIDNSVDEHLVGHGDKIVIHLHADGAIQVDDYARGIPTGVNSKTGKTGLEMAFGLHSGGKFDQNAYAVSGGLNGVGIATVAALSTRTEGIVYQNGKEHVIQFKQGKMGVFKGEGESAPFTEKQGIDSHKDPRPVAERKSRPTGTTIKFYPDYAIFDSDEVEGQRAEIDIDRVIKRAKNTAYICPTLTVVVKDERFTKQNYSFNFPNGFKDMLQNMSSTELIGEPCLFTSETSFVTKGVEKKLIVDIAFQWEQGFDGTNASFVNVIETGLGGTHVTGAQKGLEEAIQNAIQERGLLRMKDPVPELVDITEGLNLIVNVKLPEPGYSSQTKERLTEAGVNNAVRRVVSENTSAWLASRKNSETTKAVLEKIVQAARTRKARNAIFDVSDVIAEPSREAVFSKMPETLKECKMVGDPRSSLLIVEGESALGTLYKARNAKYHALFPLKGKPQNVYGLSPERLFIPPHNPNPKTPADKRKDAQRKNFLDAGHILLQNKELDNLVKVIGAGFGEAFDIDKMRYHDIFLVADADVDGGHIESLLIGFFATYMRPLIEEGRLYLALPPLFVIKAGKESDPEILLAANDAERDQILANCKKVKKKVIHVARRKGHGESSVEECFEYIMNPSTRRAKKITIEDAQEAQGMLELTLGGDANARKEWITHPKTRSLVSVEDMN